MKEIIKRLTDARLVPVVKIQNEKDALPIAEAILKGGINVMEITFRSDAAAGAIKKISDNMPEMLVGAGTLLTKDQVEAAKTAGASFFVSPGFNRNTALYCKQNGLPFIPGIMTPSELEAALFEGFDTVKFFPAQAAGGVKMIKALSAPYSGVKFMPTGGISPENICDYLSVPSVFACGGSFMIDQHSISNGDFSGITEATERAVKLINSIDK